MNFRFLLISGVCCSFAVGTLSACGSLTGNLCDRLIEECNGTYFSSGEAINNVGDCEERARKDIDDLVESKRGDCENALDACLDNENCENYTSCINEAIGDECN